MLSDLVLQAFEPSFMDIHPLHQLTTHSRGNHLLTPGMKLDVKETPTNYEILVDIPGIPKEEAKIEIKDNMLTISIEHKEEVKEEKTIYHRIERFQGSASRSVRLPRDANQEIVEAYYDNGVLKVVFAKKPEAVAKTITIQ